MRSAVRRMTGEISCSSPLPHGQEERTRCAQNTRPRIRRVQEARHPRLVAAVGTKIDCDWDNTHSITTSTEGGRSTGPPAFRR